ncbi:hypothetical protein J3R82DRAFT_6516 [Butyriboletus roseoflavus]|nr:hypothetical protein J3R82DRAFT_6516 [Butyriboletus roseoflavus]
MLQLKLLDPDEKVRAAVCKVYSQLDYETALHYVSEAQLRAVAGRGMDKKHAVRVEAMNALGKLYGLAYPEIENGDSSAVSHFAWIPNEILHISNMTSEAKAAAEQVIADYVLPLPSSSTTSASTSKNVEVDEVAWTDHLLNTMQHLDDLAVNTILSMSGIKANRPTMYEHYLQACIQNNGGVIDENEESIIQRLNNVVKHLSQQSLESTLSTMTIFLRRATLRIVNQSSISTLIKRVQKLAPLSKHAQQLLTFISKHCPILYKPHVSELTKAIADERNVILAEVGMHALAAVAKADESQAALDKYVSLHYLEAVHSHGFLERERRTLERITRFALGENPKIAKFAARLLASLKDHEGPCVEIIESISEKLSEATPEELVAHTTVLAQMARFKPDAFEHRSDTIMAFLIKKLLMGRRSKDPEEMDVDDDWVEDDNMMPMQKARILALKVCRNRCLANASAETALELATPALKMFSTLLEHSGSFSADAPDSPPVKSRMRLQAAVSLLHLSTVEAFANVINNNFIWLAITVQDPCYHVRIIFLTKLVSLLTARKLPPRFNTIPFLTIHDPEADIRDRAIAYISFISRSIPLAARVDQLEIIFIRLLHLLAHHPDFSTAHENMQEIAKYIEFYLDLIASSDNIALLYHLAMKAKTVRDSESHTYSENLYTTAELAQELIKARTQARSWTLQSYPGKVKLPSDILRALPNPESVTKVVKTQYLSEETVAWLKEIRGHKPAAATKEKKREPRETKDGKSPPAKRKASRARANGAQKRLKTQKSARWNSDQSDEEEEESDEDSVLDPSEKATSPRRSSSVPSEAGQDSNKEEDGGEPSEREKKFGRKARAKAQGRKGEDKQACKEEYDATEKVLTMCSDAVLVDRVQPIRDALYCYACSIALAISTIILLICLRAGSSKTWVFYLHVISLQPSRRSRDWKKLGQCCQSVTDVLLPDLCTRECWFNSTVSSRTVSVLGLYLAASAVQHSSPCDHPYGGAQYPHRRTVTESSILNHSPALDSPGDGGGDPPVTAKRSYRRTPECEVTSIEIALLMVCISQIHYRSQLTVFVREGILAKATSR